MTKEEMQSLVNRISAGLFHTRPVHGRDGHILRQVGPTRYEVRLYRKDLDRYWAVELDIDDPQGLGECQLESIVMQAITFQGGE